MRMIRLLYLLLFLPITLLAQPGISGVPPIFCPPNIDLELGTLANWKLYTGSCCPISTPVTGFISGRHTVTSGTSLDPFGGFPVVSPALGLYSLKLGNSGIGGQAERARYYIRIPSTVNDYSVYYRYAIVLQNPEHDPIDQPRFEVAAFDSTTGTAIPCNSRQYVSSGNLPGFVRSTVDTTVWYLSWTISSLDLSGRAGTTVAIDFSSGDCGLGGHFGYGYLDVSCGVFAIENKDCNLGGNTTLSAPPGFQTYTWMNNTYTTTIATGQTVSIPTPSTTTTYKLVLTPYTGYGCPDTLSTTITVSNLTINATQDTTICKRSSIRLTSGVAGGVRPYEFEWTPAGTLSCILCDTTFASPTTLTNYIVKVTDSTGCFRKDTVKVIPSPYVVIDAHNISCHGMNDGSATATVQGFNPFTYAWNTSPVNTTNAITGLSGGNYRLIVTDVINCKDTQNVVIVDPETLTGVNGKLDVACNGDSNGRAIITVSGGTVPYRYSWNTTPVQTTAEINGLPPGIYTVTVTDTNGCTTTGRDTIKEPAVLMADINPGNNVSCFGGSDGSALGVGSGGTTPYRFAWNSIPSQGTAGVTGLPAGTYKVTITDAHTCLAEDSITITEPPLLTAAITGSTNINCYGGRTGTATTAAAGGTGPYTYSWSTVPAQTTPTAINMAIGTYIVTITDAKGCTTTADTTITQNPQIVITPTVTHVKCNGENNGSASIAATMGRIPYTYSWNTSPVNTTSAISNKIAGNYTVTVTDSFGCTNNRIVTITEPAVLAATIARVNVSCNGRGNGTATATPTGGTAPYTYSWNTTPARTTAVITGLVPGSYAVTVTDAHGCITSANTTITEPTALASTTSGTTVSCYGGTDATATVTATGGTLPYSYSWGSSPVQTTATATNLYAGTYPVTVTDGNGCTFNNTVVITQPPQFISTASAVTNVKCYNGNDGTISITSTGGTPPYNHLWLSIVPVNLTATATGLSPGTYGVKITDSKGCINMVYTPITQPTALTSSATSTDVKCNGTNNGTATAVAGGGTTPYTYSWNTTPAQTTATPTGIAPGSYKVTVTDANGCKSNASIVINEPPALKDTSSYKNVSCFSGHNGSIFFSVSGGTTPYNYLWNTMPVATTASLTTISAGSYTITVTDGNQCTLTRSFTLTEPNKLVAKVIPGKGTCPEAKSGYGDLNISGGIRPYTILWNDPAGTTTNNVTNLAAGKYKVTVTDSNLCVSEDTLHVPLLPSPNVSLSISDSVICVGKSITLIAKGGLKYLWVPSTSVPCDSCATNNPSPQENTEYTVIGYNVYGCADTAKAAIKVIDRAKSEVDPEIKICVGDKAQLNAYNGVTYEWSPGATLSKTDISNPVAKPDSTTTYQVIVKENKCYTDTLHQTVTVYPYPEVDAGQDVAGLPGSSMQFQASAKGADRYEWTPANWLSCTDCLNPIVTPKVTTKYTLKAISPGGCFAVDTVTARIACDGSAAYLPNTFSPNGDGQNDIFYPRGDGFTTILNFRVIDRWGEVVFKDGNFLVNSKDHGWNGHYKNSPATPGVYVYVLEVGCPNNTSSLIKGDVTLLR